MLTRMYLYSTSTKLSIDVWLYLDRPGSLRPCVLKSPPEALRHPILKILHLSSFKTA